MDVATPPARADRRRSEPATHSASDYLAFQLYLERTSGIVLGPGNESLISCWMRRGQQAEVRTPGNNEKRHVAGSLHWRTGKLLVSQPGKRRNTELFLEHLDDLRRSLRSYRKIHVICDNAAFHQSRAVMQYLARWRDRIEIPFLPKYAPESYPVERVWWHFHETITRNHRCQTLAELLQQSYDWFRHSGGFYFEMRTTFPQAA